MVATPDALATALIVGLGDSDGAEWLDPCVGDGSFLRALQGAGVRAERVTAVELANAPARLDALATVLRRTDFVLWSETTAKRFDHIVANPPFVRLSAIAPELQANALRASYGGLTVTAMANYWLAFVISSLKVLNRGGRLGFILPASFEYADYASRLREWLPAHFARVEVHRSLRPLFSGLSEGAVLLLAIGFRNPPSSAARFVHTSREELITHLIGTSTKQPERLMSQGIAASPARGPFGTCADVRIGAVTGDASFFLMTEADRRERRIPRAAVAPVVTRAKHLADWAISPAVWRGLLESNERVWLFRPKSAEVRATAGVASYLRSGRSLGVRLRYKVRLRKPWSVTPLGPAPDAFISGMSRFGPWVSFSRVPGLQATNTLYTVRFLNLRSADQRAEAALSLLTSRAREQILTRTRRYAGGLAKLEPGDVAQLEFRTSQEPAGAEQRYRWAVRALLAGDERQARGIADRWFEAKEATTERLLRASQTGR